MFDTTEPKRISAKLLFAACAAIGALCFIGIYSVRVLDFTNIGWLFNNDHDLRQHFIGWCAFRRDPWRFPFGLISSLSYPEFMSVIYTDSIPLFAVIFKLLAPILPETFQYFGLFGILSFMLMGGFAGILLRRFTDHDGLCIIGSVFYVLSSAVIQRMYYHTALAAQWLIVAALVLWVYDDLIGSDKRRIIYWALLSFLAVGIHSYFLPMLGMILAVTAITQLVNKKGLYLPVMEFLSFCAAGLVNLYVLGAFYGGTSPAGPGLGTFGSNLNTFINPWEIGQIMPRLPLLYDFQYEGMAYLGAGILLLYVIVAGGLVVRRIRRVPEEAFHSKKIYGRMTIVLVIVSFVAAVLPTVSYNDIRILTIPYPQFVEKILSIFRSNGRLVWPAMYVLITAAVSFTAYTFRRYRQVAFIVLAAALMLQICDMTNAFSSRYSLYTSDHPTETLWDEPEVAKFIDGKDEFIFLYTDNDITMQTAYYGYLHGMRQNNYYYARDIEDKVQSGIDHYYSELGSGSVRDTAVYVIKEEEYENDRLYYDALPADIMKVAQHVIFRSKEQ